MTDPFSSSGAKAPAKPFTVTAGRREVRSFVLRQGRFTPAQQRAFDAAWPQLGLDYTGAPRDFDAVFGRQAPRIVEIGFGNGEALRFSDAQDPARDGLAGDTAHDEAVGAEERAVGGGLKQLQGRLARLRGHGGNAPQRGHFGAVGGVA